MRGCCFYRQVLDESKERIESVKAGALAAVSGSLAMAPLALLAQSTVLFHALISLIYVNLDVY